MNCTNADKSHAISLLVYIVEQNSVCDCQEKSTGAQNQSNDLCMREATNRALTKQLDKTI